MWRAMSFFAALTCTAVALASPLQAQNITTNQTLDDCKLIPDDTARLACYDRVIKAGRANVAGPSGGPSPAPTPQFSNGAGAAGEAAGGPATVEAKDTKEEKASSEATGRVASIDMTDSNLLRVTTTSGEIWEQTAGDPPRINVGDTIAFKRNSLGGTMCKIGAAAPYNCVRAR